MNEQEVRSEETIHRLFLIEAGAARGETIPPEDVLWLLDLNNFQHTLIGKYEKFVEGVIDLGPDGVAGLVEFMMGRSRLIPWEDVKDSLEE